MKYTIDTEELKSMLKSVAKTAVDETDPIIDDTILAFKLFKQPIELVFEGEYLIHSREGSFENPEFWEAMSKINDAKQVKIFIEVMK